MPYVYLGYYVAGCRKSWFTKPTIDLYNDILGF